MTPDDNLHGDDNDNDDDDDNDDKGDNFHGNGDRDGTASYHYWMGKNFRDTNNNDGNDDI